MIVKFMLIVMFMSMIVMFMLIVTVDESYGHDHADGSHGDA